MKTRSCCSNLQTYIVNTMIIIIIIIIIIKIKYKFERLIKIERKAMIRNRYNYSTPPIRDIKGKETQTRNNWTLMETSLAESQTDSYFPTKWPLWLSKTKRCKRHTHIQRRTITKISHDRRTALERSVKSISLGVGRGGGGGGLGVRGGGGGRGLN